jgi:nucleoid DNA-binding protein
MDETKKRQDIVEHLHVKNHAKITHAVLDKIVLDILEYIQQETLDKHNRVELRRFGVFTQRESKRDSAHNPRTLEKIGKTHSVRVAYSPGKNSKRRMED